MSIISFGHIFLIAVSFGQFSLFLCQITNKTINRLLQINNKSSTKWENTLP